MPLFTILHDDSINVVGDDIVTATKKGVVKKSFATFKPVSSGDGYLSLLDKRTSDVVQSLIAAQNQGMFGLLDLF